MKVAMLFVWNLGKVDYGTKGKIWHGVRLTVKTNESHLRRQLIPDFES